jgi:hypothetical protein
MPDVNRQIANKFQKRNVRVVTVWMLKFRIWSLFEISDLKFEKSAFRFSVIVHYLPRTRKPQFITGYPFDIGGIVFERGDFLPESAVVLLEFGNLYRKSCALRLHPIVFYHSHFTHDAGNQKVEPEKNPCRNEGDFPAGSPGMLVSLYIVAFAHGCSSLQPGRSS